MIFHGMPCLIKKTNPPTSKFGTFFEYKVVVGDTDDVGVLNVPNFLQGDQGYAVASGFKVMYKLYEVMVFAGEALNVQAEEQWID